ncbi:MAG: hypothetical protein CR217_19300, partial [Beijerinckiaceae bacterium]
MEHHVQSARRSSIEGLVASPFVALNIPLTCNELADTEEEGLIVAGLDGEILHLSPQAERLLLLACYPQFSPEALRRDAGHIVLPPPVVRI